MSRQQMAKVVNHLTSLPVYRVELRDGDDFDTLIIAAPNEPCARAKALQRTRLDTETAVITGVYPDTGKPDCMMLFDWEEQRFKRLSARTGLDVQEFQYQGDRHFMLGNQSTLLAFTDLMDLNARLSNNLGTLLNLLEEVAADHPELLANLNFITAMNDAQSTYREANHGY